VNYEIQAIVRSLPALIQAITGEQNAGALNTTQLMPIYLHKKEIPVIPGMACAVQSSAKQVNPDDIQLHSYNNLYIHKEEMLQNI